MLRSDELVFGLSEIDQDAYPLLMAWQGGFAGDASFYRDHVRPAADSTGRLGPGSPRYIRI